MIRYSLAYPNRVALNEPGYPDSKAQNLTSPGTGTPADERWVNDMWGSTYAIIGAAGFSPNGVPESIAASQVLDAIEALSDDATQAALDGANLVPYAPGGAGRARRDGAWVTPVDNARFEVTPDGPTLVAYGSTVEYKITNYNVFSVYAVEVPPEFTASVTGDTVTITAPATYPTETFEFTLVRDGSPAVFTASLGTGQVIPLVWAALPRGLNSGSLNSVTAMANNGTAFVVGFLDGYAAISTDEGLTWSALPRGLNSGTTGTVSALAASGDVFVAGFAGGYAAVSTDAGATWSALPQGLNSGSTTATVYTIAANDGVFIAGLDSGYAAKSIGGSVWTQQPRGLGAGDSFNSRIGAIGASDTLFVAGTWSAGYTSRSDDEGGSWSPLSRIGVNVLTCELFDNTVLIGGQNGYLYRSTDSGDNFVELPRWLGTTAAAGDLFSVVGDDTGVAIAGLVDGYAALSVDYGETWVELPRGLSSGAAASDDVRMVDTSGTVWLAGFQNGYVSRSIGS